MNHKFLLLSLGCLALVAGIAGPKLSSSARKTAAGPFSPPIPTTWDDRAMANLELPLADPARSPKHVSADYYYKIPVRPIYKSYSLYAPDHVPSGCGGALKNVEPVILWDDQGHRPPLKTDADWIKAGEIVFDSPILFAPELPEPVATEFYRFAGRPITAAGVDPFAVCVVREKGKVEVGFAACADCHTRVMSDGSILKGAQGNNPIDRGIGFILHGGLAAAKDRQAFVESTRQGELAQFEVPSPSPSDQPAYNQMSVDEIAASHLAIPGGVFARQRTSVLYPPHIPDLIGVRDRRYLDATGLHQHRDIVDMMRYAALNQGGDNLASYGGFVPAGGPEFRTLPGPDKLNPLFAQPDRYSDEQLYALAMYIYSLQAPPNPNKFDVLAARGKEVFNGEGCAVCHTPPLYTNNKLTPAKGFKPPPGAAEKYATLPISVSTDPNLATKTRRGTGYYKVPSLKGVWYRGMFGHSGWCATLEDWFDPRRTRDDYVPTGFKPYGVTSYAVKGHTFGLDLNAEDKKALIAFLKTL